MFYPKLFFRLMWAALVAAALSACGGGGSGGGSSGPAEALPTPALNNVLAISVGAGPPNSGYNVNRLYTSVTVCHPDSRTRCQTIDHVLVDTGSTGLRVFASAVSALGLNLLSGNGGLPLLNCAQFVDGTFSWGPVATADIVLGGKTAASVAIQVMADPAFDRASGNCSGGGDPITTPADVGGNGILGIGFFKQDCGEACVNRAANGFYYTCADSACTTTIESTASTAKQVKNPVPLFAADNNGIVIELPAVNQTGSASLNGSLTFGIGTQTNNQRISESVLSTNSMGSITTWLDGRPMTASFIDSGSNGLYFDSRGAIPTCVSARGFYCPSNALTFSATLVGANAASKAVSFTVDNALPMFTAPFPPVLPNLAGPFGNTNAFDWGLPFFYGRRVFIGIEGQVSKLGTGPLYAF